MGEIHRTITTVKTVHGWAHRREYLALNLLAAYRFKTAKEDRTEPPAEYTAAEREAILKALSPLKSTEWRPHVAVAIAARQGARMNAILHLQWDDVDFTDGEITWRARWDKTGREWSQPLRRGTREALEIAWLWRERDGYRGPWIFYSSHTRKRALGDDDPGIVYDPTSLERALGLAEQRAGVTHLPYRAMHGFRRALAGDVLAMSGDMKLAMEFIGDRDVGQAASYLKRRPERLSAVAAALDEGSLRSQTVPGGTRPPDGGEQALDSRGLTEQARQDLNLQPPVLETGALPIELRTYVHCQGG